MSDSAAAAPHNVPPALSSFVGRTTERVDLATALVASRLVTVTGPGGAGKTRLAREIAADAVDGGDVFPDGVWWVELAPLSDGTAVAPAVATVLGVRPSPGRDVADAIVEALRGSGTAPRRMLLVLDNCEHVVEASAALAERLLRAVSGLTVLATSREALAVEGEKAWVLPPLASPRIDGATLDAATIADYEAVRLFVERARATSPTFALTDRTASAVAAITARLDGLPLALELAAASVGALGVEQVAARLDDAFSLLTRGRRTALPRHRTLRALLDWSYQLLANDERLALAHLALFRGAFTLDAAEALGVGAHTLGRLVEQSLVEVGEEDGETRFRLLETVKQYGLARLAEDPARELAAHARHAAWVDALTAEALPATWSGARGRTIARLERDLDDIRAAVDWTTAHDALLAVRIAASLAWFWYSGVSWSEARLRTAAVLAAADRSGVADDARPIAEQVALAELLYAVSGLAFFAGEPNEMLATAERSLALWDHVDRARAADPAIDRQYGETAIRGRAVMHQLAGLAHVMFGRFDEAIAELDRSVAVARAGHARWMEAVMLARRGLANAMGQRADAALADYRDAAVLLREVGEMWFLSLALEGMAAVELARGSLAVAASHARESVAVLRDEPDAWFISRSLDTLAAIAVATGPSRATIGATLAGAATGLRARCGAEVIGSDRPRHAATLATLRATLGDAAFETAFAVGAALDLAGAHALAESADVVHDAVEVPNAALSITAAHFAIATLAIRALGPLEVTRDGVALTMSELPAGKVTELLLHLVLHPEGRTKEEIGLALWPDASAGQLRGSFHVTVHRLRRALGSGHAWVTVHDGRYALAREITVDGRLVCDVDDVLAATELLRRAERRQQALSRDELTRARRAFAAARGELAEGLALGDWIVAHQDRLRAAWADGMQALGAQLARAGRSDDAADIYVRLVTRDPLRESAHRALMQAYADGGEPARALAHYDTLTRLLEREVGTAPARETRAIADRLRAALR